MLEAGQKRPSLKVEDRGKVIIKTKNEQRTDDGSLLVRYE
jgi:hypothetical protein